MNKLKVLVGVVASLTFTQISEARALTTLPSNAQLVGDATGLISFPEDNLFLYGEKMKPGDVIERTMSIENNYEYSYNLFLRAERVSEKEEYDLLTKLKLTVYNGEQLIYEGPASGEDGMIKDIDLGEYEPGEKTELYATIELDGPSTGNEYKNKYAEVNWIFTAVRSEETPPVTPPVEETPPVTPPVEETPPVTPPVEETPTNPKPSTGYAMSGVALLAAAGCIGVGVTTYVKRGKDE